VIKAILMDPRGARQHDRQCQLRKLREPVVEVVAVLRALNGTSDGVYRFGDLQHGSAAVRFAEHGLQLLPADYPLPGSSTLVAPNRHLNTSTSLGN